MATDPRVMKLLVAIQKGEQLLGSGRAEEAVECFRDSLTAMERLPDSLEGTDKPLFIALLKSKIAGGYGALGVPSDSIAWADEVLDFFDRFGSLYENEYGHWCMTLVNKGAALTELRKLKQALDVFNEAKKVAGSRLELSPLMSMCDGNIQKLKRQLANKH